MTLRGAAALLAAAGLALAAAGCKPSSLTPLWLEERGPEAPSPDDVNGLWRGQGSAGETVQFQVGSGTIADIRIASVGACARWFSTSEPFLLDGDSFAVDFPLTSGGRIFFTGTFTSGSTCSGSYSFLGVSVIGDCPREGGGSFVAAKSR